MEFWMINFGHVRVLAEFKLVKIIIFIFNNFLLVLDSMSKKDTNKDSMKKKGNRGRGKRRGADNTDSGGCTVYNIVQIL